MTTVVVLTLVLSAIIGVWWLHGEDLSRFDKGYPEPVAGNPPSDALHEVMEDVEAFSNAAGGTRASRAKIHMLRAALESLGADRELRSQLQPSRAGEPAGEWVFSADADTCRRLLYVHGGGFVAGSPRSHRAVTDALAQLTGMAVFSLDYRLVPEHPRLAGLEDTVSALRWLNDNGPDGPAPAEKLVIAGDSAGGSLTLAALQQCRSQSMLSVDAAVAICPSTDAVLRSPSLTFNQSSDPMLGRSLSRLIRVPAPIRHTLMTLLGRRPPRLPALSPLRGNLAGLPPTLLQVSLQEMLLDDAARYYHRASEAGSPVELETYANMVHVWHMFYPRLPEAEIAMIGICDFLRRHGCVAEHKAGAQDQRDGSQSTSLKDPMEYHAG